jgi:phage baseplate assembly protein W
MSVEAMVPLQIGPSGTIATVTDQDSIVSQHVQALISVVQGERLMLPGYGLPLAGMIFADNDPVLENVIQNDVIDAFQQWEPDLTLLTVTQAQSTDIQSGIAAVNVTYQSNQSNTVSTSTTPITQQASISTGGTIVDK